MPFMLPDEFLFALDVQPECAIMPPPFYLSPKNKAALREVGVQTLHGGIDWFTVEPAQGEYDFSSADKMIKMNREVGIKTIINVPWRTPNWMSDGWLIKNIEERTQVRGDDIPFRFISL